ncbi:tyrosine-type recombinase/integrase [Peribacillus asahii]|uniref:tyrosine-type recombinase/integrase n=1 Tax=Peribacillus asahii TaxID=228899 RepID=UPI003804F214
MNKGTYVKPQNIVFKDFALEWFDGYKHNLRDTSTERYKSKINNWIIPILGNYKLQDIKPVHGQMMVKKLLETLEPVTAHKTVTITKMILRHAVDLELIIKNPFVKISVKEKKKDIVTWSFEELTHFLDITKKYNEFYFGVFAIAAYTGLRKGEILGLEKSDIDFDNNKITVKQSVAEITEKGVYLDKVKTPSSYRQVAIDSFISSILKKQINKNNQLKLKLGENYKDYDLIFCHPDGRIYRPSSLNRPFRNFIKQSGVPYIRFHDLRHTHATLLLKMNVNPKIVADRLGHSSVKITLDTYSHSSIEMQTEVAENFSKLARKV